MLQADYIAGHTAVSATPAGMRATLDPKNRLHTRSDFENAKKRGNGAKSRCLVMLKLSRGGVTFPEPRLGLSVSKIIGGAVSRNRVKRLIREAFRTMKKDFDINADFLVIARIPAASSDFEKIRSEMAELNARLSA